MTVTGGTSRYLPLPGQGRTFTAEYQVRLGDSAPSGRVRFDGIARYLQDVAEDDANDVGWPKSIGWLLSLIHILVVVVVVGAEIGLTEGVVTVTGPP